MEIIYKKLEELKEYENNPRYNDEAVEYVANSISEYGFKNPIVVDGDNTIIAGHTRKKASELLGLKEVPVIVADDLNDEQIKAYRLVDNKVAEFSEWNFEKLEEELAGLIDSDMSKYGFDELEEELDGEGERDELYTDKIQTPIYEITGEKPGIDELVDSSKSEDLIGRINSADIPEDIRDFLIKAAYRHIRFDYSNIAEFYAHSDKEVQELMEDSALVIIDYDKAIQEGYATVSDKIDLLREEDEA